jgi:ribosomal protein S3
MGNDKTDIADKIIGFYDEKYRHLIESVEVNHDEKSAIIICDTSVPRNKNQFGRLIGRKGKHVSGVEEIIQNEFGSEWNIKVVEKKDFKI